MISYELHGDTAWITIDRPEKLNALNMEMWEDLRAGVERASDEARAAVITGSGEVFCAGDDIAIFESFDDVRTLEDLGDLIFGLVHAIEDAEVPVIAAVNGDAHGGGCEIIAACDLAVATESARFSLPETRIGVMPGVAVSRVAEVGGRKRGMDLMLTGDPIPAETAREWGLVNRVVPPAELESNVEDYVDAIRQSPKRSVALTKRYAINGDEDRDRLIGGLAHLFMADEAWEGITAFLEDREPEYADSE